MIEKTGPTIYKGESIYKTGAGGGGGGIDINEYFEACPVYWNDSNNQAFYFPTGTISNKNLRIKGKFYSPNGPMHGRLFSLDSNSSYQNKTVCIQYQNSSQFLLYNGANVIYPTPPNLNGVYEIDVFQNKFKINGVDYLGGYSQDDNLKYIYVLPGRIGNYAYSETNKSALIELKLINTDTDNIICHFIGAKRKSDNRPYVIDLKNALSQFSQNGFLSAYPNP